ncbi:hypothetical protein EJ05DRAFT_471965 [Pseudovirgaria hyperparasitica]|uniref:Cell surface protein n=1 Tax=Pseudovirgaria hyperparasitica TaxID=470096 RepID=A0A6A6WLG5_9PEZI|nr:uncharacterized protein EJ05DRAFT_471965 [Pseudovirgaria hyperparasitica]KAF2763012.1 hypothetical protein EJ05DRAFT_471965 [Pseudovirgaria hyperparasitica]
MSNILNKVTTKAEELLHKHNTTNNPNTAHTATGTTTTTHGTTTTAPHTGATHQGHSHGDPTGISSTGAGFGTNHGTSTNAGPHNSNVANKLDPRVDSDRDGRAAHTGTGYGSTHQTTGTTGAYGANENIHSSNHGPHSSNLANKLDPRVDSDRDGNRTAPGGGDPSYGTPGAHTGTSHSGTGIGGVGHGTTQHSTFTPGTHTGTHTGAYGNENPNSTNHGPHGSNLMNKVDPRVDSDRDGNRTAPGGGDPSYGAPGAHTGNTYGTQHGTTHGGNSGFGTTGTSSSYTPGSGNASNTAGPHDSNLLNKLDPRVDSDRDGSKTTGGNATYR